MKKLRTPNLLYEHLDDEFAWRLKEIDDLKSTARSVDVTARRSILRASIPILYAHWEGFIKSASEALLNYVNNCGHSYRCLQPHFIVFGAKKRLHEIAGANTIQHLAIVEFFLNELDNRAEIGTAGSVKTEANLSSVVFERIATSLGIDASPYATKYVLIDKSLLERRNCIAHGKYLDIELDDLDKLASEIIYLMRSYKTDVQNLVLQKHYLSPHGQSEALGTDTSH